MLNGNSVRLDFLSEIDMLDFVNVVSDHLGRTAGLDEDALYTASVWQCVSRSQMPSCTETETIKTSGCSSTSRNIDMHRRVAVNDGV